MWKPLLAASWVWLMVSGCALPQQAERYHFAADAVTAFRYAGREQNPIDGITVNLAAAPPFQLRFPDGHWAGSRDITRQTLVQHGVINDRNGNDRFVAWHPDIPPFATVVGRHQYIAFRLDGSGAPFELSLGACGHAFDQVLRTSDGARTFGFPLSVQDAEDLFGKPTRIESFRIITGFSCL